MYRYASIIILIIFDFVINGVINYGVLQLKFMLCLSETASALHIITIMQRIKKIYTTWLFYTVASEQNQCVIKDVEFGDGEEKSKLCC